MKKKDLDLSTEDISLSPVQEAMFLEFIDELSQTTNEFTQIYVIQKHIKLIWEQAQSDALNEGYEKELH